MREEHHLGEIYKDLYVETGFLSKNYTRVEVCCSNQNVLHDLESFCCSFQVYIQSTDVDRTLMSGESMLSGLYPPDSDQVCVYIITLSDLQTPFLSCPHSWPFSQGPDPFKTEVVVRDGKIYTGEY